ncbi:MAG: bifunctional [glutamine synthetase] adenylyltransferase/[glutamine synthetase]-adenylyl-L-tyrosine phosphorylase [Alphaproteobacteria bacterium]
MSTAATRPRFLLLITAAWPDPSDQERARLGLERWHERANQTGDPALVAFATQLAAEPGGVAMLRAIFGNSPYLTESALAEIGFVRELVDDGVDRAFRTLLEDASANLGEEDAEPRLMAGLRRAKRRGALLIALADISERWSTDAVTGALSQFADTTLVLAVRHLLRQAASRGVIELVDRADPERGCGLIVLAMGKLGGRELNYSSDIDLIVLYDDARVRTSHPDQLARTFVRMTRDLVRIMEERTPDGYVFRTDLRLRPDPGATPLAVSVAAAESYYESMALNWERAAMIKARPVAGDIAAGSDLLRHMRPFVWRRNLDFAAVQDIHNIKRRIHRVRGHAVTKINGHDIKLGRGGIREIEFFAQTQQLIFGGRNPRLRADRTCDALDALAQAGRIGARTAEELAECYRFLRRVEHRLQMIDDRQTHTLPEDDDGVAALAVFLGYASADAFRAHLGHSLRRVEEHYAELFEEAPATGMQPTLNLAGTDIDPDSVAAIGEFGFANPQGVIEMARGWLHGRYRATRSERARALLNQLAPTILGALAKTPNPDAALARFDEFLRHLPAGIQLFSLFYSNPDLLDLTAEILGTSNRLADYLARNPVQLDCVLTPGFFDPLPDAEALGAELDDLLAGATDYEEVLDGVRRWTNDNRFRAGVQMLRRIDRDSAFATFLSDVAEVALRALQTRVAAEFARRHGGFDESSLAVIAMGKLGSREMTTRSDLDLIMVYDAPPQGRESDGARPLAPTTYYTRLIQRLISAITAPTAEGPLYEVDMRLRPSGRSGPLASSLDSFVKYQRESAWTWEHMALTRARVISGPASLRAAIDRAIHEVLCRPRDDETLLRDVADMRARIEKERGTQDIWNSKYVRGGLVDIEFIAQYLQLRHAAANPDILSPDTCTALRRLGDATLLDPAAAADLIDALRLWQRLQAYLRLTVDGGFDRDAAPVALLDGLARVVSPDPAARLDPVDLEGHVRALADRAYGHFQAIVETPAARLAGDD